jgi:hypothetical protein
VNDWRSRNVERVRRSDYAKHLRRKFGITVDQYFGMLEVQNGRCAICSRTPEEVPDKGAWRLAVDHCHKTGKIRGLLCRPCNTAIGQLQESPEVIRKALAYVEENS